MHKLLKGGFIGAAFFFLFLGVREASPYVEEMTESRSLQLAVIQEEGGETEGEEEDNRYLHRKIDWETLREQNPDIIGWILVPGTKIDYPIVKCGFWNEYLHKNVSRRRSVLGAIFVQPETSDDFSDPHTVIFGHNMRSKQMFGSLHNFEKESFFEEHREFYIYQPSQILRVTVYSTYDCRDGSETYRTEFTDDFESWKEMTVDKSYFSRNVDVGNASQVITLSTCSNGRGRNSRYVVHGVVEEIFK